MRAKTIKETINFERGLDPKQAMGIGQYSWHNGWRLVHEGRKLTTEEKKYLLYHIPSWSRKATEASDVNSQLEVTDELVDILEKLPVIDFKSYYSTGDRIGLFPYEEWPDDFPKFDMFIANVESADGMTYLIDPQGFDYARYMLKLV